MSIFDPVYRPARSQQSFLAQKQRNDRKRKRNYGDSDSTDDEDATGLKSSPSPEATPRTASTAFHHPVNRTDPYHVAGKSRQDPLPPSPFPHAPIKDQASQKSVEQELSALNPPLYVPKAASDDQVSSLKRRHIDNTTTLLHTCMLRGDWKRASRAWGLLLRTEMEGRGMDLRQQGRWGIGAELLMRRNAASSELQTSKPVGGDGESVVLTISDECFRSARDYYERLILQYPHTPRTQYMVNALAFYPALFNIWVYEVQDRAKRKVQQHGAERPQSSAGSEYSGESSPTSRTRSATTTIHKQELEEAVPIAQRMDELLVSPPYDSSASLLQVRGMVGLWLSDLHAGLASTSSTEDEASELSLGETGEAGRSHERADHERKKALGFFRRAKAAGADLPGSVNSLLGAAEDDTV